MVIVAETSPECLQERYPLSTTMSHPVRATESRAAFSSRGISKRRSSSSALAPLPPEPAPQWRAASSPVPERPERRVERLGDQLQVVPGVLHRAVLGPEIPDQGLVHGGEGRVVADRDHQDGDRCPVQRAGRYPGIPGRPPEGTADAMAVRVSACFGRAPAEEARASTWEPSACHAFRACDLLASGLTLRAGAKSRVRTNRSGATRAGLRSE